MWFITDVAFSSRQQTSGKVGRQIRQFVADFCTEQNPSAPIERGKTAESVSAVKSHRPITGLGSTLFQKKIL